jgi:sporulation protein YlmC with PRC-barrel domain
MNARFVLPIASFAFCFFAVPLLAGPSSTTSQRDTDVAHAPVANELRRADRILDAEIQDGQGYKLGKVKELALDFQNGRVLEVIMETGGVMGGQKKLVALPPEILSYTDKKNALQIGVNMARIQGATEFDATRWEDETATGRVKDVYQYFGVTWADASGLQTGYAGHASKLLGSWTWTLRGEKLAKVETFMVDLPAGRCVEVILSNKGFSPVPPQSFVWNADKTSLKLDTTKDALKSAPHFSSSQWSQAGDPASIAEAYSFYHVGTEFLTAGANPGSQNVREQVGK